jgi:hypothetical protein
MRNYKVKTINSLARGLEVLQAMRAASLHDLHQTTGLSKSTLTRIVHTLHCQGMVWQRMADGAYLPSHSLQQRAQLDNADRLVEIASPVLEDLCRRMLPRQHAAIGIGPRLSRLLSRPRARSGAAPPAREESARRRAGA